MSENVVRQDGQLVRTDGTPVLRGGSPAATCNPHRDNVVYGISNTDATGEGTSDDMTVGAAASLRWQINKFLFTSTFPTLILLKSWSGVRINQIKPQRVSGSPS